MTDQSPEPQDPWAPPERPAVELGKPQATPGMSGPPSVHDQPTIAGMPGGDTPPAQIPGPAPATAPAPAPAPGAALPPAYGYPAQPDPGGYAYPGPPPAQPAYGYPGQQGYPGYPGYPGYGYPAKSNGFGITAMVLGIIGVVTCYLGVLFGVPALVFGILGRKKAQRGEADNGSMALAGIILGAIGIVISILMIGLVIAGVLLGGSGNGSGSDYDYDYDGGSSSHTHVREHV
ncbi:DUF4190 domain-containing protein [Streptomyces sp. NPDC059918]|uniref:DUF4190 domain-containing protein n=1 Tax=unclassified Streptomyces TaxID=2593676 RepID=UPI003650B847